MEDGAKLDRILAIGRFARGTATHAYQRHDLDVTAKRSTRRVAVHCFTPHEAPNAMPLVLLPGGAFSGASAYFDLGPRLLALMPHRTMVFVDTPGSGASDRRVAWLSHRTIAALIAHAVTAVLGPIRLVLGGHSQGGAFAQIIARRLLLDAAALVLIDPQPAVGAGVWRTFRKIAPIARDPARVAREFLYSPVADEGTIALVRSVSANAAVPARALLATLSGRDCPDPAHPYRRPTLIVGAEASQAIDQNDLRAMSISGAFPSARYVPIRHMADRPAGHCDILERAETAAVIHGFLTRLDQTKEGP